MKDESLGESLHYEDRIPIRWQVLEEEPGIGEHISLSAHNRSVFQAISLWDESDEELNNPVEQKLDLILVLLAQSLIKQSPLPTIYKVCLSSHALAWQGPSIERAHWMRVELYLSQKYPMPLGLLVRYQGYREDWVQCELLKLDVNLQDELDKFIFRQHRRAVALSKQDHD